MKKLSCFLLAAIFLCACGNANSSSETKTEVTTNATVNIQTKPLPATAGDVDMQNIAYFNAADETQKPIVLVLPEWWGLNDYAKYRAEELAKLGYLAIAVDIYGNSKAATTPDEAGALAKPFYSNPQMGYNRILATLSAAKQMHEADTENTAAIGYCFGGALALNAAKLGAPLDAVVSFHGNLKGVPPTKNVQAKFLVLHGAADQFVSDEEVANFKKEMDAASIPYTFIAYPNATHAFTNPSSTETGKKFNLPITYNPAADTASWAEMKHFLKEQLEK